MATGRFPRAAGYNPEWVLASISGAAHPLWMAEWLSEAIDLAPGMRVLDLGCGRALSSIFLHRGFGVQVFAVDLWFSVAGNLRRARDAGAGEGVFPIHADARVLPFAAEFFDAVVSFDSFMYYGTDDLFLGSVARLVKPGGVIAIAGSGLTQEIEGDVPEPLRAWWTPDHACLHSAAWWARHWDRTGIVDVLRADTRHDGWKLWHEWHLAISPDNAEELRAVEADRGRTLGYVRVVARRRPGVALDEPIVSIPTEYKSVPLRGSADIVRP